MINLAVVILLSILSTGAWMLVVYWVMRALGMGVEKGYYTWSEIKNEASTLSVGYLFTQLANVIVEVMLASGEVSLTVRIVVTFLLFTTVPLLGVLINWTTVQINSHFPELPRWLNYYLSKTIPSLMYWIPSFYLVVQTLHWFGYLTDSSIRSLMIWYLVSVTLGATIPTAIGDYIKRRK